MLAACGDWSKMTVGCVAKLLEMEQQAGDFDGEEQILSLLFLLSRGNISSRSTRYTASRNHQKYPQYSLWFCICVAFLTIHQHLRNSIHLPIRIAGWDYCVWPWAELMLCLRISRMMWLASDVLWYDVLCCTVLYCTVRCCVVASTT